MIKPRGKKKSHAASPICSISPAAASKSLSVSFFLFPPRPPRLKDFCNCWPLPAGFDQRLTFGSRGMAKKSRLGRANQTLSSVAPSCPGTTQSMCAAFLSGENNLQITEWSPVLIVSELFFFCPPTPHLHLFVFSGSALTGFCSQCFQHVRLNWSSETILKFKKKKSSWPPRKGRALSSVCSAVCVGTVLDEGEKRGKRKIR